MPKILIIRFSSIGDIVLTTPVIRCIKLQLPNAEVHFLTKKGFASILVPNPYIDRLWLLDASINDLLLQLETIGFDYIVDLHNNLRSLRVKHFLRSKGFAFDKLNIKKWLFTNFKWNKLPTNHIVDRYLDTVASLGVVNDGKGLDYFIPTENRLALENFPSTHYKGFIAMAIGAALATKQLPKDKLIALCKAIRRPMVLLGGSEDRERGEAIAVIDPVNIFNGCGLFNLHQSASIIQLSRLLITPDTGLMHIGAALQKPIISIWGNTVPSFGMTPYYGHSNQNPFNHLFEVNNLYCRPCSKIGYAKCPKGHFKCMNLQPTEAIAQLSVRFFDTNLAF